jgi:indolepyruvate decarboxylase
MKDIPAELTRRLKKRSGKSPIQPGSLAAVVGSGSDPITVEALYPRWANFLKSNDILVAETGTSSMGLVFALMPKGATFHNQILWGSIGWATPAALGAAVAAPDRRLILVTGEGSHQLTAQEISQFGRRDLKPIVFVLNNSGYLIERLLCKNPGIALQRFGFMTLLRTTARAWLRRLVHRSRHHMRGIRSGITSCGTSEYCSIH